MKHSGATALVSTRISPRSEGGSNMPMRIGPQTADARFETGFEVSVKSFSGGALGSAHLTPITETGDSFAAGAGDAEL